MVSDTKTWDRIQQEVDGAVKLLRKVTDPNDPDFSVNGDPAVTPRDIVQAPGLVFHLLKKAGVGIGVLQGRGFVLKKLQTPDGRVCWSAPLFFRVVGMSLGAIVGWEKIETLVLPATVNDVHQYLEPKSNYGLDWGFGAGHTVATPTAPDLEPLSHASPLIFSYTDHAGIIDISLKGATIHRDDNTIEQVYGSSTHPRAILDGQVPPPEQFKPVYEELRRIVDRYNTSASRPDNTDTPVVYISVEEYVALSEAPTYPLYDAATGTGTVPLDTSTPDPLANIDTEPVGIDPALLAAPDTLHTVLPTALRTHVRVAAAQAVPVA